MKTCILALFLLLASGAFAQTLPLCSATVTTNCTHNVALSWVAPTSGGSVTGYNVKRATVSGGPYATVGSTTGALSFLDSSTALQTEGATFFFVVSATGPGGESANSAPTSGQTIPFSVPGSPAAPTASTH